VQERAPPTIDESVASHWEVSRTVRVVALSIGLLCLAGVVFGRLPGLKLPVSESAHDDGFRATIGWGLTIPLLLGVVIAAMVARRGRMDAAFMWSVFTLAVAGMFLWVKWVFIGFGRPAGETLWPSVACAYTLRGIGLLHVILLLLPAIAERRAARACVAPAMPRAIITSRRRGRSWPSRCSR